MEPGSNNIWHFADLPDELKTALLKYIDLNFTKQSSFNYKHTAYGLKQHFSRTHKNPYAHITAECFSEAMISAGFKRKQLSERDTDDQTNWVFNARVPTVLKP